MTDEKHPQRNTDDEDEVSSSTSPPGGKTHEATTPPGQGDRDEDATRTSEDNLYQAGGGH